MILDFVFDMQDYSTVRISRLIEIVNDFMKEPGEKITRLEYLTLLADITTPFPSCPVNLRDSQLDLEDRFNDIKDLDGFDEYKLKLLADSGIVIGGQNRLLRPDDYITRAEAVVLAGRVVPGIHWRPIGYLIRKIKWSLSPLSAG